MSWVKQGRIFHVENRSPWMVHHAALPVPDLVSDSCLRIYFAPRDADGRSRIACLDVDPRDPSTVLAIRVDPVLDLGPLGTFDDCGTMPMCVVDLGRERWMYYQGWNVRGTVPYHNAIGLAVSTDGGATFARRYDGPVMDRSATDPYFAMTPFVLRDGGTWRMWYGSGRGWVIVDGRPEPVADIRHAESPDGLRWTPGPICIAPTQASGTFARPWVVRDGNLYRMWYSYRDSHGFRTDPTTSYRIGYAESCDGFDWIRKDDDAGINTSDDGWDSLMIEYPAIYEHDGVRHLLYNGNGFGESGIGHARYEER
jgi:hypothetical protein